MKRFRKAAIEIIKQNHELKLKKNPNDAKLLERLALLNYEDRQFENALGWFGKLITQKRCDDKVWGAIARAERTLWADDSDPARLQRAVNAYQEAIRSIEKTPAAVGRFPHLLFELGRCYEDYGAFEGSLKLYSQVLEMFPKFRLIDAVTFRFAVVLKHLTSLPEMAHQKKDLLERAMGYVQPLMLERPGRPRFGINQRMLDILYARICEEQRTQQSRMLAAAAWEAMFDTRVKNHEDVSGCPGWQDWVRAPTTWVVLGSECLEVAERTMGVDLINRAKFASGGQQLGYAASLTAAKAYASFQRMDEAINYAEAALEMKPLDPAAMDLLSKWSPEHRRMFKMTLRMAQKIQRNWRTRPWKQVYLAKIKKNYVETYEEKVDKNHFDDKARNELIYYSKAKWRPVVLAEVVAAKRIQKAIRNHLSWNRWMKAKKDKHIRKLAALYRKWRKYPYDMELRKLVHKLVDHKDTPNDHKIRELPLLFQREEEAASKLQRQFYVWKARQFMKEIREVRALMLYEKQVASSIAIQCAWRQHVARRTVADIIEYNRQCWESAVLLQRIWRGRKQKWNFFLRMLAIKKEEARKAAELHLALTLQRLWRGYVERFNYGVRRKAILDIQRIFRGSQGRKRAAHRKNELILRIQRLWNSHVDWSRFKLLATRMRLKNRRPSLNLGGKVVSKMISESLLQKDTVKYASPGLNPHSKQFKRLLYATAVVFDEEFSTVNPENNDFSTVFEAHDAILLSSVLRSQGCQIQTLLLKHADLSNEKGAQALVAALPSCRSLTCLGISHCSLSFESTVLLLETIRTQSFRIEKLVLESNEYGFADEGALYAGKLISDYFHHQFGKFHHLSLSQNHISDAGAVKIGEGLKQNSMLLSLSLCDNFVDNEGAIAIAQALRDNSTLTELDLSDNRITSKGGASLFLLLMSNRTLISLSVANNLIKDDGVDILHRAIANNFVIRRISLCGNMLSASLEEDIQHLLDGRTQNIELPNIRPTSANEDGFFTKRNNSWNDSNSSSSLYSESTYQGSHQIKHNSENIYSVSYSSSSNTSFKKVKQKKRSKKSKPRPFVQERYRGVT